MVAIRLSVATAPNPVIFIKKVVRLVHPITRPSCARPREAKLRPSVVTKNNPKPAITPLPHFFNFKPFEGDRFSRRYHGEKADEDKKERDNG